MTIPNTLKDAKTLLSEKGFAVSKVWYHGTSSAVLASILEKGLKRSGDKVLKQAAKNIMATIGNSYTETIEPVFLTQSKELAYYWATEKVRERGVHSGEKSEPVVLEIKLSNELNVEVKTDVGAASLLLIQGNGYLEYLSGIYKACGFEVPTIDPANADRLDYLNKMGVAYINQDIDARYLAVCSVDGSK